MSCHMFKMFRCLNLKIPSVCSRQVKYTSVSSETGFRMKNNIESVLRRIMTSTFSNNLFWLLGRCFNTWNTCSMPHVQEVQMCKFENLKSWLQIEQIPLQMTSEIGFSGEKSIIESNLRWIMTSTFSNQPQGLLGSCFNEWNTCPMPHVQEVQTSKFENLKIWLQIEQFHFWDRVLGEISIIESVLRWITTSTFSNQPQGLLGSCFNTWNTYPMPHVQEVQISKFEDLEFLVQIEQIPLLR